jgi:hypothetical protein
MATLLAAPVEALIFGAAATSLFSTFVLTIPLAARVDTRAVLTALRTPTFRMSLFAIAANTLGNVALPGIGMSASTEEDVIELSLHGCWSFWRLGIREAHDENGMQRRMLQKSYYHTYPDLSRAIGLFPLVLEVAIAIHANLPPAALTYDDAFTVEIIMWVLKNVFFDGPVDAIKPTLFVLLTAGIPLQTNAGPMVVARQDNVGELTLVLDQGIYIDRYFGETDVGNIRTFEGVGARPAPVVVPIIDLLTYDLRAAEDIHDFVNSVREVNAAGRTVALLPQPTSSTAHVQLDVVVMLEPVKPGGLMRVTPRSQPPTLTLRQVNAMAASIVPIVYKFPFGVVVDGGLSARSLVAPVDPDVLTDALLVVAGGGVTRGDIFEHVTVPPGPMIDYRALRAFTYVRRHYVEPTLDSVTSLLGVEIFRG